MYYFDVGVLFLVLFIILHGVIHMLIWYFIAFVTSVFLSHI